MAEGMIYQSRQADRNMIQSSYYIAAAVFTLLIAVLFLFSACVDSDTPAVRLQGRINPNEAPVASLERLPQIGLVRANKIVAYRQAYRGEGRPFKSSVDLQRVHGIGPKTARQLSGHLIFEKTGGQKTEDRGPRTDD